MKPAPSKDIDKVIPCVFVVNLVDMPLYLDRFMDRDFPLMDNWFNYAAWSGAPPWVRGGWTQIL